MDIFYTIQYLELIFLEKVKHEQNLMVRLLMVQIGYSKQKDYIQNNLILMDFCNIYNLIEKYFTSKQTKPK